MPFDPKDPYKKRATIPIGPLNEEYVIPDRSLISENPEDLDFESFLTMAVAQKVSDIHLRLGSPPIFRKDGAIIHTRLPALNAKAMQKIANWLIPENIKQIAGKRHDLDFSVDFRQARFRVNMLYELGHVAFVIRVIPTVIPSFEDLGLPKAILDFTQLEHGLVLITGSTGSGKSTTLAGLLNKINLTQAKHIITLEDPVEFIYKSQKSVITQRQLMIDTPTFPEGIKYALRQDPNVLLIGEMRDRETALSAIKAAETGALVFSTLHTSDAIQTLNRLIDFFEPHERDAIRIQLANVLRGIVSQKLYRKPEGIGRSCVAEVMMVTSTIRDYLLRNQVDEIYALMDEGRFEGMQSMNFALFQLVQQDLITTNEALRVSNNPLALRQKLKGAFHGTGNIGLT